MNSPQMSPSRLPIQRPAGPVWTAWVLANLVGGFGVGLLENNGLQFMATLMLTGALVGTAQWVVLRPLGGFRGWPLVSALGWIGSSLVLTALGPLYRPVVDLLWQSFGLWEVFWLSLVQAPLAVAGMALAQGWVLRRRGQFPWGWLLVSLAGGALQGAVSATLCAALCASLPSLAVGLVQGLGWAVYGLATGIWLGRRAAGMEELV